MTPAATPGPSGSRRHYVAECLTPVVGSVGEEDSVDDERNAEIDRPPRIVVSVRHEAAVVQFIRHRVRVAVDCS